MSTPNEFQNELTSSFLRESVDFLREFEECLLKLEKNQDQDEKSIEVLLRITHNLKGTGRTVGFEEFARFSHEIENLLVALKQKVIHLSAPILELLFFCCDKLKDDCSLLIQDHQTVLNHDVVVDLIIKTMKNSDQVNHYTSLNESRKVGLVSKGHESENASKEEYVRISLKKVDELLNNFGEQVILQSVLDHSKFDLVRQSELVVSTISKLSKLTYDLQQTAISLRMIRLKNLFTTLERTARDTGQALSKKVSFEFEGQENELDKTIVDALADPLIHMMRNAIDHGIEEQSERERQKKPPIGKVFLKGYRKGGHFYIVLEDDGRGIDPEVILKKAKQMNLVGPNETLNREQVLDLIFENGFSTKETITDISGRGVGMNVVREVLKEIKGQCQLDSTPGKGTRFIIRLPLTLSVFNGIVVRTDGVQYVIPCSEIQEILSVDRTLYRMTSSQDMCVQVKDRVFPVIRLSSVLRSNGFAEGFTEFKGKRDTLLIIRSLSGLVAIAVDEIVVQQKIVHKNLGPEMKQRVGVTGATILGDGTVSLILELSSLVGSRRKTSSISQEFSSAVA